MTKRPELSLETDETRARCRECGAESPAEARFCIQCGSGLVLRDEATVRDEPTQLDQSRWGEALAVIGSAPEESRWSAPPELPPDPLVGRVVAGRYRVLSMLGSGGMGVVYRVEHVAIGKVMALKVLHDDLARRPDVQQRFRREAEAASRLASAHTVQVFDFGESDGRMFLVMEYIDGTNLDALVEREGALPFARAARIAGQVCASVGEAHALGIVHRDLKPENVMIARIDGRETAKVLDFGLAKLRMGPNVTTVTTTGMIVGTPEYMSPEQIRGEPVDARGDVYAIGALLYHACTGSPPFVADMPFAVLTKHLSEPLVPPSRVARGVPAEADAILERAMAKHPDERYASAAELRAALVAYLRRAGEDLTEPALRLDAEPTAPAPSRPRLRIGTMDLDLERRGRSASLSRAASRAPLAIPDANVDAERSRPRRGLAGPAAVALLVALLVGGGYALVGRRPAAAPLDPTVEHEPNDDLGRPAALPERFAVSGHIGRRSAPTRGDADVYELVRSDEGELPVRVDLGPIPNLDLVLEVFEAGQTTPRFVVDGGGVGEGEIAPNLPPPSAPYVVRVRERVAPGGHPIENVSDRYTLRWQRARVADELEREPNDSLEAAAGVAVGGAIEGYIGHASDVDVYCLAGEGGAVVARASGVPEVDLVLRVVDRLEARSRRLDAGGAGAGEETDTIADAREGRTCFEVSARRVPRDGEPTAPERRLRSSRGDARYTFDVLRVTEAPAPPR